MGNWIIDTISSMGIWGVGVMMFIENVFPPIPSELIMPLAGYLSVSGSMRFWPAIATGSVGSLAGATLWYLVARRYSKGQFRRFVKEYGVWLGMDEGSLDRSREWFDRHGNKAVFLGRLVPGIRTLISVPAGLSRMPFLPFILWSAAGTVIWTIVLAWAGRLLGQQFKQIGNWLGSVSWVVLGAMLLWYLYRVFKKMNDRREGMETPNE